MSRNVLDSVQSVVLAMTGGGIRYTTLQLNPLVHLDFWQKLIPSLMTAALCALAGLVVKDGYRWLKLKLKRKPKKP